MKRAMCTIEDHVQRPRGADRSTYSWAAHPAREQPGRAMVGVIWIIAVAAVIYATTFNIFWPVFAVVFLLAALNRFFFPSRFVLDDEGITATSLLRTQRMKWAEVKRFLYDKQGGMLSDRREPSRWDTYRGLHVMFGREGLEAARTIEQRIASLRQTGRPESERNAAPEADASGGDA